MHTEINTYKNIIYTLIRYRVQTRECANVLLCEGRFRYTLFIHPELDYFFRRGEEPERRRISMGRK